MIMKNYFQLDPGIIHLNHAAVAPWPVRTAQAVAAFADENVHYGSLHYLRWVEEETRLRSNLARLINTPSGDDIALLKSTSEGLSFIAYGLTWQAGDNIVIPAEEFPSNRLVWESLSSKGVELRLIPVVGVDQPEAALLQAFDKHTRLLSVSSVQYASGLRLQLTHLGSQCRQRDVLFCVDAIQSLGAIQFDQAEVQADFIVADGHKWMLGPEGLALFYCKPELREQLTLHEFGWHMVEQVGDFSQNEWQAASTARRFECGSPNSTAVMALNASLAVLFEVGMEQVERAVLHNSRVLHETLSKLAGITLHSPGSDERRAGIVNFSFENVAMDALFKHLQQQGVLCALRGEGIRFSPHFHTHEDQLIAATEIVAKYIENA